ncbi:DUF1963 domain-containing protein [Achromobacter sp. GG226]|uniref:DUF1963 domain-containing protein n=1 Tax=Verticiella alkaliphila TaxID=2779529 RepID=UPI001C0AA8D8|nr:DUF1963 domain-containing protein [Verticiella sp. GG226]MBU4611751.1 DUF1963 domain-containing protein [Verticiella sp. GG226]
MFDAPDLAVQAMQTFFTPHQVQQVAQALVPAIGLEPTTHARASRLGGVPELPEGSPWPRPDLPADIEAIAKRGNPDAAKEMRAHLEKRLPFAFIGQIDLAEAHALGEVAEPLPSQGRLLFFYDLSVGPWESGSRVARVMWVDAPAAALRPLAMPPDLVEAAQAEARMHEDIRREFNQPAPEAPQGTNYGAPARPVSLTAGWGVPDPASLEMAGLPALQAYYRGESQDEAAEAFAEAYDEMRDSLDLAYPAERWRRHQLLGSPTPEQDDPRFQAVITTEFGEEFLDRDTWKRERSRIFTQAQDWRLLLQVDLADWSGGSLGEGTVYFVIRTDDLAAHRFDRVVAVYQQT